MEIFKLFGSVFIEDNDAHRKIDEIDSKAKGTGSTLGSMIGTAAKWGAGIVAGAGAAVTGLFALATKTSETASEINDLSVKTGLSMSRLQELKFITGQVGSDFGVVEKSIAKLTQSMGKADVEGKGMAVAFEQIGVNTRNATDGSLRPAAEVFDETLLKLSEMTNESERNVLAFKIFGKGANDLVPLMAAGKDGLEAMKKQAHDLGLVLSDEAVAANDEFGDKLDAMQSSLGAVGSKIGTALLPMFQSFLDWVLGNMPQIQSGIETAIGAVNTSVGWLGDHVLPLVTDAFKFLGDAIQFMKDNAGILIPVVAALTGAITAQAIIDTVTKGMKAWSLATQTQTTLQWLLNAAMDANPLGLLALAIGAVIAVGILLYKNWDTVSAFLSASWQWISDTAVALWTGISDFFSGIWDSTTTGTQDSWNAMITFLSDTWNSIITFLTDTWNGIVATASTIWGSIINFFTDVWNGIVAIFQAAWDFISPVVLAGWNNITTIFSTAWTAIQEAVLLAWEVIKELFAAAFLTLVFLVTGEWDKIGVVWQAAFGQIHDNVMETWVRIQELFVNAFNTVVSNTMGALQYVQYLWNSAVNAVITFVMALVVGLATWFVQMDTQVRTTTMNMVNAVIDWFAQLPGRVASFISNLVSSVSSWFVQMDNQTRQSTTNLVNGVVDWFSQLPSRVMQWVTNLKNQMFQKWQEMKSDAFSMGKNIIQGMIDGIMSMASAIAERAARVVRGAVNAAKNIIGMSPSNSDDSMPHYATGTSFHPGGYALVGEHGPEIVELPRGAGVMTNEQTQQLLSNNNTSSKEPTIIIQQMIVRDDMDIKRIAQELYNLSNKRGRGVGVIVT